MNESKVSYSYIRNHFKIDYKISILITSFISLFLFTSLMFSIIFSNIYCIQLFKILFYITIFTNILLFYLQYNKKNCKTYEVIEYLGKREELEKNGYQIISENEVFVLAMKELN